MNAKEIAFDLKEIENVRLGGATPWKTVGARLAEDIRSNPHSSFVRLGSGLYGLRSWPDVQPVEVRPRTINPLDEYILVVDRREFTELLGPPSFDSLYDVGYSEIIKRSRVMYRRDAEETDTVVQLIPSFPTGQ